MSTQTSTLMKNRDRRSRRWHGLPHPKITSGLKGGLLLALAVMEGWFLSFALTHSRLAAPLGTGTPQWMITGSLLLAVIIPLAWLAVVMLDEPQDE